MAKKTLVKSKKTFEEELLALGLPKEAIASISFNAADLQLLIILIEKRDKKTREEVLELVWTKLAEHNKPFWDRFGEMIAGQQDVLKAVDDLSKKICNHDTRINYLEIQTSWWMRTILLVGTILISVFLSIYLYMQLAEKLAEMTVK